MPNLFICKSLRSVLLTAFAVGVSVAQTSVPTSQVPFDSIKPAEWSGNLLPSIGSTSAPIKVVFFVDYQCPTCRLADPVVRKAISKRSDVALIYRQFPLHLHPLAESAAIVAENARANGTFDLAHERLMVGQSLTEEVVKEAAQKAGVSMRQTSQTAARIESDRGLEKSVMLTYVPCFILIENGKSTLMNKQQVLDFLK